MVQQLRDGTTTQRLVPAKLFHLTVVMVIPTTLPLNKTAKTTVELKVVQTVER